MALRTGNFDFDQEDIHGEELGPFVFVPKDYDFRAPKSIDSIFFALKTEFPPFVFHFGYNNGLGGRRKEEWAESFLSTIPPEGAMFLIARPYGGNTLARIATHVAIKNKIRSLALLCCAEFNEDEKYAESNEDEKDGDTFNQHNRANYIRTISTVFEQEQQRFLTKEEDFTDKTAVPIGDVPQNLVKASADYTKTESSRINEVHVIPGLLSDECSHRLVFETKHILEVFLSLFEDTAWMAHFASGSSSKERDCACEALRYGKPLILLEGTGEVSTEVHSVVSAVEAEIKASRSNRRQSSINRCGSFNPFNLSSRLRGTSDNDISDDEKLTTATSEEKYMVVAKPDAVYTVKECPLTSRGAQQQLTSVQKKIIQFMIKDFSNTRWYGPEADIDAVRDCRKLQNELRSAGQRYWIWAVVLQLFIEVITITSVLVSSTLRAPECPEESESESDALSMMEVLTVLFTFCLTVFRGFDTFMDPLIKYARFHFASEALKSEEYRFRTKTGVYKAPYWCHDSSEEDSSDDEEEDSARKKFKENATDIYKSCMDSEAKQGYLKCFNCCFFGSYEETYSLPADDDDKKWDDDDCFAPLPIDEYVKERVDRYASVFEFEAFRNAIWRNILELTALTLTASGPVLSSTIINGKSRAKFIPLTLSVVSSLKTFLRFTELDTGTPRCNEAQSVLRELSIKAKNDIRYMPEDKDEMVDRAEKAIMERKEQSMRQMESVTKRKNANARKKNPTAFLSKPKYKRANRMKDP
jgi:hypothetical protein